MGHSNNDQVGHNADQACCQKVITAAVVLNPNACCISKPKLSKCHAADDKRRIKQKKL